MPDGFCTCQFYWLYAPSVLFLKNDWMARVLTFSPPPGNRKEKKKRLQKHTCFQQLESTALQRECHRVCSLCEGCLLWSLPLHWITVSIRCLHLVCSGHFVYACVRFPSFFLYRAERSDLGIMRLSAFHLSATDSYKVAALGKPLFCT